MFAELEGQKLVFLPRHGRGHRIPPSELNFRANIDALKRAGVTEILSLSAVGSCGRIFRPVRLLSSTSSSTAPSREQKASSIPASLHMYQWPNPFARVSAML